MMKKFLQGLASGVSIIACTIVCSSAYAGFPPPVMPSAPLINGNCVQATGALTVNSPTSGGCGGSGSAVQIGGDISGTNTNPQVLTSALNVINAAAFQPLSAFLRPSLHLSDCTPSSTCRTNLGLGTAATQNTGTSGANVPLLSTANTWTLSQTDTVLPVWPSQSANTFWAATSGSPGVPSFRTLVGADLPNPTASTLGGVESIVVTAHQWVNTISTSGVPSTTQPAFTDISGVLGASQCPNPGASSLGCTQSIAAIAHDFLTSISTSGVPTQAQPATTDLSDIGTFNLNTSGSVTANGITDTAISTAGVVRSNSGGVFSSSTALPTGTTATTPSAGDNSAKVATTQYIDSQFLFNYGIAPVAGRYYFPPMNSLATFVNGGASSANIQTIVSPFMLATTATPQNVVFSISAAAGSSWTGRVCVYNDSAGKPNSLVVDGGTQSFTSGSTGAQIQASGSWATGAGVALNPGRYWVGMEVSFLASGTATMVATNSGSAGWMPYQLGFVPTQGSAITTSLFATGIYLTQGTFGACANPAVFNSYAVSNVPVVALGF